MAFDLNCTVYCNMSRTLSLQSIGCETSEISWIKIFNKEFNQYCCLYNVQWWGFFLMI